MNTQHQIVINAAVHSHGWCPGTDYYELAEDAEALYQTVCEYAAAVAIKPPTRAEFLSFVGYEDDE